MMLSAEIEALESEINDTYIKSGNSLGWRLLASPLSVLGGADIAFIGLHPGGRVEPDDHPRMAPEQGSAYVDESWAGAEPGKSPLQVQVRALFEKLGVEPNEVLAGNLVPYRSPSFDELKDSKNALKFGTQIWARIIQKAKPSLIIVMGKETENALIGKLSAKLVDEHLLGWGNYMGRRWECDGSQIVSLPHLSRFKVINRDRSQAGLSKLFGARWEA